MKLESTFDRMLKTSLKVKKLRQKLFSNLSNTAKSGDGWKVPGLIDTLAGNDLVKGTPSGDSYGIKLANGSLSTSSGDDRVVGASGRNGIGIYVNKGSVSDIITGHGTDTIKGSSGRYGYGIFFWNTTSQIFTGAGSDKILGEAGSDGFGIVHYGTIETGKGADQIKGTSKRNGQGLFIGDNRAPALIHTGSGSDRVTGISADIASGINLSSNSTLITGSGGDIVRGRVSGMGGYGITNSGSIRTGSGDDVVNALRGGFAGSGKTHLGDGQDILKGFGSGTFFGGNGTDKILFGEGVYSIATKRISMTGNNFTMKISDFERIGGTTGTLFDIVDGILTVGVDGVASFVPA